MPSGHGLLYAEPSLIILDTNRLCSKIVRYFDQRDLPSIETLRPLSSARVATARGLRVSIEGRSSLGLSIYNYHVNDDLHSIAEGSGEFSYREKVVITRGVFESCAATCVFLGNVLKHSPVHHPVDFP